MLKKIAEQNIWEHKCRESKGKPAVYADEQKKRAYMIIEGEKTFIKHCPYCGTIMDNEILMHLIYSGRLSNN